MAGHTERDFENAIEHGLIANGGYIARAIRKNSTPRRRSSPTTSSASSAPASRPAGISLRRCSRSGRRPPSSTAWPKELASKGALGVLRHGFKCYGKTLRLAYFRPNSGMIPEAQARYATNRLTITRQVEFVSVVLKRADGLAAEGGKVTAQAQSIRAQLEKILGAPIVVKITPSVSGAPAAKPSGGAGGSGGGKKSSLTCGGFEGASRQLHTDAERLSRGSGELFLLPDRRG